MRIALLLLLTGCADAVRNGYYTGDHYKACMKRIDVDPDDDEWPEADKVCRQQARAKVRSGPDPDSTTICRNVPFTGIVCEHYDR